LLGRSKATTVRALVVLEDPSLQHARGEASVIGHLRGRVLSDEATGAVVLDVHGVGYEVSTPVGTVGRARADSSAEVELWVHTHVREDALDLFGFATEVDRRVFRLLLSVPNVGPKTALGVLSAMPVDELARALERGDHARLGKIPGIGKKTAERLVLELREKLRGLDSAAAAPVESGTIQGNEAERLLSALVNMGYRPGEAERAVSALGPKLSTEPLGNLLREALAKLTP
jgi:Holliday junction DNA helicase RuvA